MSIVDSNHNNRSAPARPWQPFPIVAIAWLCTAPLPASADTVSHSVDVNAAPSQVWELIGPFCAIKDWLPPVGSCTSDHGTPPTRTLVTKDGKATFVEKQIARSESRHFYSYQFQSSPLPVKHYSSTIEVSPSGDGFATVTWRGTYTPHRGKEKDAQDALNGIYSAGLESIKSKFTKSRPLATRNQP
jgi:hypothetical protein